MLRTCILTALLVGAGSTAEAGTYRYKAVELMPLAGSTRGKISTDSYGINNAGQSVGRSINGPAIARATLWDRQGNPTALATPADAWYSKADGINNHGVISGDIGVGTVGDFDTRRAVVWTDPGHYQYLLPESGHFSTGDMINDNGWIAGIEYSDYANEVWQAYVRKSDATVLRIDGKKPGSIVEFFGTNNVNRFVGQEHDLADMDGTSYRAVSWTEGSGVTLLPQLIAGSAGHYAQDINEHGVIVGGEFDPVTGIDYAWWLDRHNELHELSYASGFTNNIATWINNRGLITGFTYDAATCDAFADENCRRAALWDQKGHAWNLNDLIDPAQGVTIFYANVIDDRGDIQAEGARADGSRALFLLTPVPEPGTVVLVGLAISAVAGSRVLGRKQSASRKSI